MSDDQSTSISIDRDELSKLAGVLESVLDALPIADRAALEDGGTWAIEMMRVLAKQMPSGVLISRAAFERFNGSHPAVTWDIATLDELQRRRNAFMKSWGEVIDDMRAEAKAEPAPPYGPGAICEDCGHFAERHDETGCHGAMPSVGCRFGDGGTPNRPRRCVGMLWNGVRRWSNPHESVRAAAGTETTP